MSETKTWLESRIEKDRMRVLKRLSELEDECDAEEIDGDEADVMKDLYAALVSMRTLEKDMHESKQ